MKNFKEEFFKILMLIQSKEPFAFARFSDGEVSVLKNKHLVLAENYFIQEDVYGENPVTAPIPYMEEERKEEELKTQKLSFVNTILEKEALLGKLEEDNKDARVEELSSWDGVKLEGYSIAMESIPVPEDSERTFGKGKAHDAEETPVEAEDTPRMFAMENGKIKFAGYKN